MSKEAKPKTGTKEWAGDNVNIQIGCENGCRYCYARWGAVEFHKYCSAGDWPSPRINKTKVDKNYGKFDKGVMVPSTHDITTRNIYEVLTVIQKLIQAGNKVLIVSKPRWSCITQICESIKELWPTLYKAQVTFRFTIGSTSDEILKFWEPNAPNFKERWACLKYAFEAGFNTSVSCEPYLDQFPNYVYEATESLVSDKIWVGMLRNFDKRVNLGGVTESQMKRFVYPLKTLQSPMIVKAMYNAMKDLPKITWKDSIRKVVGI